jgi:hypothetical protein
MPILPRDTTLRVAIANAAFCSLTTTLYVLARIEPSPMLSLFLVISPPILGILWLQKDARRTHLGDVQDWGFFVWIAWPILVPWYAFKSRGRAGGRLLIALILLFFPAYIAAMLVTGILGALGR